MERALYKETYTCVMSPVHVERDLYVCNGPLHMERAPVHTTECVCECVCESVCVC